MTSLHLAIVGGGVSGLATAFWLTEAAPERAVVVLEKAPIAGGKVRSTVQGGFTFDWGPNGFVANAPDTRELLEALGLEGELESASAAAKARLIFHDGGLRELPTSPGAFLKSELLSPIGKARAALELWRGARVEHEESVFDFLARHFGPEVARAFADVAVTGVSAGDPRKLSLDALFPRFRNLEREHGSLLRGLRAAQGQPGGLGLSSFGGGVGRLSEALSEALGDALVTGTEVTGVRPLAGSYALELASGEELEAEGLILASPAFVSAALLEPFAPEAARLLRGIPYADVGVFGLGYDRMDVPRPLDGFGFLVPRGENVRSLGVLWSSSVFPGQAPEGKVMLRVIAGGSLDPAFLELSDEDALAAVQRDLEISMGVTAEPELVAYMRWPKGIPQYQVGHLQKLQQLREALAEHPNLFLSGNAYEGVGVNDCLRNARRLARQLAAQP